MSITYCECVFVALVTQQAMRIHHTRIVICGLSGCTVFFSRIISQTARFTGKIY